MCPLASCFYLFFILFYCSASRASVFTPPSPSQKEGAGVKNRLCRRLRVRCDAARVVVTAVQAVAPSEATRGAVLTRSALEGPRQAQMGRFCSGSSLRGGPEQELCPHGGSSEVRAHIWRQRPRSKRRRRLVTFASAQVLQPPVTMPTRDTSTSQVAATVQTRSAGSVASPAASSLLDVKRSSFPSIAFL